MGRAGGSSFLRYAGNSPGRPCPNGASESAGSAVPKWILRFVSAGTPSIGSPMERSPELIAQLDLPAVPSGHGQAPRLRALHHRRGLLVLLPRLPIRSWSHFSCSGDAQLTEGGPPWKGHSLKAPLGNPPFLQLPPSSGRRGACGASSRGPYPKAVPLLPGRQERPSPPLLGRLVSF